MSVEGSEYSLGRVRNDRKKRACGSARHPLALLPVPDGFNRNAQSRREFNLGQPRPLTQIFDLRYWDRFEPCNRALGRTRSGRGRHERKLSPVPDFNDPSVCFQA
jgi:hypothetical protein